MLYLYELPELIGIPCPSIKLKAEANMPAENVKEKNQFALPRQLRKITDD
jgi:hypothetical protein